MISPVLANMFLHYVFDMWMVRNFPLAPFERYADDGVIHCRTKEEALWIKEKLTCRFEECKLELHPVKTRIVYCKDKDRNKINICSFKTLLSILVYMTTKIQHLSFGLPGRKSKFTIV